MSDVNETFQPWVPLPKEIISGRFWLKFFVFVYWSGHFANVFNSSIPTSINFPYCEINTSSDQNLHSPNVNHNEKGKPLIMLSTNLSLVFLSCFNSFFFLPNSLTDSGTKGMPPDKLSLKFYHVNIVNKPRRSW